MNREKTSYTYAVRTHTHIWNHWTGPQWHFRIHLKWRKRASQQAGQPVQTKSEWVSDHNDYLAGALDERKTTFEPIADYWTLLLYISSVVLLYSFHATGAVVVAAVTTFSSFLDFERKGQLKSVEWARALFFIDNKIVCKSLTHSPRVTLALCV